MGSKTLDNKTKPSLVNPPSLQRGLSSITGKITKWNSSRSTSPVKKLSTQGDTPHYSVSPSLKASLKQELNGIEKQSNAISSLNELWYEKYQPTRVEEVCIHKRKADDVSKVLESMILGSSPYRILLLSGPSGCSKSTLVKQLANKFLPEARKRNNRIKERLTQVSSSENCVEFSNSMILDGVSPVDNFSEFLTTAKYRKGENAAVILVEDFPNLFHLNTRLAFQQALLEWLYTSDSNLPPLVLCLTECEIEEDNESFRNRGFGIETSWTVGTVLGSEILNHKYLKHIKFNPINMTLMKKHLNLLCEYNKQILKENNKWTSRSHIIKEISSNTGDLRSAVATLQFWATSSSNTPIITNKTPLSIFHAIGRIIHGSKDIVDDTEMIDKMVSDSQGLVSSSVFKLSLLENYSQFNKGNLEIKVVTDIVDALSETDCISDGIPESLEYTLRRIRNILRNQHDEDNHHGKAGFPKEWKLRQLQSICSIQAEDFCNVSFYKYKNLVSLKNVYSEYGFYAPFVIKHRRFKQKSLEHYIKLHSNKGLDLTSHLDDSTSNVKLEEDIDIFKRIGGEIKELELDSTAIELATTSTSARRGLIDMERESKDRKLRKLQDTYTENESAGQSMDIELLENDPIEDPDDESNEGSGLDDDEDDSLYELLSQKQPLTQSSSKPLQVLSNNYTPNESLSDSDLEALL